MLIPAASNRKPEAAQRDFKLRFRVGSQSIIVDGRPLYSNVITMSRKGIVRKACSSSGIVEGSIAQQRGLLG